MPRPTLVESCAHYLDGGPSTTEVVSKWKCVEMVTLTREKKEVLVADFVESSIVGKILSWEFKKSQYKYSSEIIRFRDMTQFMSHNLIIHLFIYHNAFMLLHLLFR